MTTRAQSSKDKAGSQGDPIIRLVREAMTKVWSDTQLEAPTPRFDPAKMAGSPVSKITVSELATAFVAQDPKPADDMIAHLLNSGVDTEDLCRDHLAPAARELGRWWEQDAMPFVDVTIAVARMQSMLRTLPSGQAPAKRLTKFDHRRRAAFAAVPGETHTLGVVMAADHLRRLGWDIELLIDMDHNELAAQVEQADQKVIGLSCSGRHSVPALKATVEMIRRRRPDVAIVIGGSVLADDVARATLPKVEGFVTALDDAERLMMSAIENVAVPA